MALIKCPECTKEISDRAPSCPNCGCPVNSGPANAEIVAQEKRASEVSGKTNKGIRSPSALFWSGFLRGVAGAKTNKGDRGTSNPTLNPPKTDSPMNPMLQVIVVVVLFCGIFFANKYQHGFDDQGNPRKPTEAAPPPVFTAQQESDAQQLYQLEKDTGLITVEHGDSIQVSARWYTMAYDEKRIFVVYCSVVHGQRTVEIRDDHSGKVLATAKGLRVTIEN